MQTFLPHPNFTETAQSLDRARLGKQRVETLQIMKSLTDPNHGWKNHPAVKMWKKYTWALLQYQAAICQEWSDVRGYKDTCFDKTVELYKLIPSSETNEGLYPDFIGNRDFHLSHQSNLLRKKPEHYSQFWNIPDDLPYVWPV